MARVSVLLDVIRPWFVRILLSLWGVTAGYDGVSNQFGLQKIPKVWGMTGSLLPWWGWLLVLQAIFVFALFEYVRRNAAPSPEPVAPPCASYDDTEIAAKVAQILVRLQGLDAKAEQVRVDAAIASRDVQKLEQKLKDRDSRVLGSFYALGARERLTELETEINQNADDLYDRLKAGEVYDLAKWQQWENVYNNWKQRLDEWIGTGKWYAAKVKERTLTIDEALYGADWSVAENQFPNAEAVRQFRKHRIVMANWLEVVPQVRSGMDAVAFSGQTESDVRNGEPAG